MSLIIDYPWYFVLLCLLLGVAYSFVLYWFKTRRGAKAFDGSRRLLFLLSALRVLAVTAIAFLLLAPLVKQQNSRKEKPIVIIAQDNSKSLDYCADSAFYHTAFLESLDKLAADLGHDFEVVRYTYGSTLRQLPDPTLPLYEDNMTDMGMMVGQLTERYYHRNVGALIVTGDGICNQGVSPLSAASALSFPVYTVAMGDTTVRRDVSIANVRFNRIAYLGNNFPMEITVNASRLKGSNTTLSVTLDGKKLYSKQLAIDNDHFSTTESVILEAEKAGIRNYIVEIAPAAQESNLRNNRRAVPIEIIDGHQKVAIIAAAPHPDIAALRSAISHNPNFEVEVFIAKDFKGNPKDYNLLILHQLPCKMPDADIDVASLLKNDVPAIFILGAQTDLPRFNALHSGLEVFSRIDRQNESSALVNKDFTYFTVDDAEAGRITLFPPLLSPFGDYKLGGNAQTLFWAKVGSVNSHLPLVAMTQQQGLRYCFVAGEGLWRWRLADWQSNQTHADFDNLINKLVVFSAIRANKDKFRVETSHLFGQSENIVVDAQLYNDNYEPVNTPDVELTIRRSDSLSPAQTFLFNRVASGYSLNVGQMPPGNYSYSASTRFNGQTLQASGSFLVEELHLEAVNPVADHALLNTLAVTSGGTMVEARQISQLSRLLHDRKDLRTIVYSETRYSDMLNMPLILILIIVLLSIEWVVRKYNGEI